MGPTSQGYARIMEEAKYKAKILVVDDEEDICEILQYNLEKAGYQVKCVLGAEEALSLFSSERFDLLLLDIMLPEEDGISILRKLRADPATEHLPVIMLTAKSTEYDHVEGLDAGADDYVAKPFGMMELLARVRAVLRRAETGNTIGEGSSSESGNAEKPGMRAAGKTASAAARASGSSFAGETASAASA